MAEVESIFSKEAIEQLVLAAKYAEQVNVNVSELKKTVGDSAASQKAFADAQREVNKAAKENEAAMKTLKKETDAKAKAEEKAAAKAKEYADAIATEAKTLEQLTKQNKALVDARNKVDTTTKEGTKRIKEINKQLDDNNKKIKENSSNLEKQKINVGNYISSWGPFQGVARMVTQGIGIMKIAFASLKAAIISTGIGALLVAVASLIAYFTRTERGADNLKKIMAGLGAIISVLIDRVIKFGEGLFKIFTGDFKAGIQDIKGAFVGITDEIRKEYELARQLAEQLDAINDARRAGNVEQSRLRKEIQKELEIARDAEYPAKRRLEAWERANKLSRENLAITEHLNNMEMANMKARLDMAENTEKDFDDIAALQAKMYDDEARAQTEINSLIKLGIKIKKQAAEEDAINASRTLDITRMTAMGTEQVITDIHLEGLALREQADIDFIAREMERLEAQKQARIKAAQEYVNAAAEIGQSLFDFNQMLLNMEAQDIEQKKAHELQLAGDNATKRMAIEKKYDEESRKLKIKQAKQDKAQALFTAIIKTAQAVLAGLAYGPPLGYIFAALNAVLGAVQIGVIASQPIPAFAKGTKRAGGGLAVVGEKGRELIMGADGSMALSPGTASLVNLGKGGQRIYNNRETELLLRAAKGADDQHSKAMMDRMHQDNRDIVNAIKNKPVIHISKGGQRISARGGQYYTHYLDRKLG